IERARHIFRLKWIDKWVEQLLGERSVPAAEDAGDDQSQVGRESSASHVFGIELALGWKDDGVIEVVELMRRNALEHCLLAGKCNGGSTGYARPAGYFHFLVLGDFGARSNEAHMAQKHVKNLRKFIELPAAQEGTDEREGLILRGGDSVVAHICLMQHGAKLGDGEDLPETAHAFLQEQHRTWRREANAGRNNQQDRD